MNPRHDEARVAARQCREAVLRTLGEMRQAAAPPQLVEAALVRLDPQLRLLQRLRQRVECNKLLTLAIVAGAAWLAGVPLRPDGGPPAARKVRRAKPKEKNNDS